MVQPRSRNLGIAWRQHRTCFRLASSVTANLSAIISDLRQMRAGTVRVVRSHSVSCEQSTIVCCMSADSIRIMRQRKNTHLPALFNPWRTFRRRTYLFDGSVDSDFQCRCHCGAEVAAANAIPPQYGWPDQQAEGCREKVVHAETRRRRDAETQRRRDAETRRKRVRKQKSVMTRRGRNRVRATQRTRASARE